VVLLLAEEAPKLLTGFETDANNAIDLAKKTRLAAASPQLRNQIVEDVERGGVNWQLSPPPNAANVTLKPNLVALANGEVPALTFDTIQLTETFSADIGGVLNAMGAQGTAVKLTITVTTTGTRDPATDKYSYASKGDVDMDINRSF
jgi:hypothetical protein